jgi:hypothetical protein
MITSFFGISEKTLHGGLTVAAGMMIHFCLGIVAMWGNIVIYITSKLRYDSPNLTIKFALFVFPMTLAMGSLGMQLANRIKTRVSPRRLLLIGGSIFVSSLYLAQFSVTFLEFFFFYSLCLGFGYGLIYFLPVECAWSYFPEKQSTISGVILCFYSLGAISFATYSVSIVNPDNEAASI